MIIVSPKGAPSPIIGRVKGLDVYVAGTASPVSALDEAMQNCKKENEAFLFVASGGKVRTFGLWSVLDKSWSFGVRVDRIGSNGHESIGTFNGVGRVSLDTVLVRADPAGRRVFGHWWRRTCADTQGSGLEREAIQLAIALRETGELLLHLPITWVWREAEMRAIDPSAEPVVEFSSPTFKKKAGSAPKVADLATAAVKPEKVAALGPGVLWVGHLYQYTGYGKANREILFRLANTMSVKIDDSHKEPIYVREDLRVRLDAHRNVLVGPRVPLLRMMGPDHISQPTRHRIVWTMQETSVRVHEDMVKRANENFDELWTPSQWNADVFRFSGMKMPMRVMPLGVNPMVFRPTPRRPLPPCRLISTSRRGLMGSPSGFVFLTIGLPGFRKGWDVLADAAEIAFRGSRNVHVVIGLTHAPPAWNAKVYKQFAKYKVPIWTLEGSFDEHELARIYCSANAYVSASRGEGFNLPAAEAAACGIPVIVPNNTCHTEIFGPEAFLFQTDGVKAYPEGDWISDWYKGQVFSKFEKRAIRELAQIMSDVVGARDSGRTDALRTKIITKYTWDVAADRAAARLLEVQ